MCSIKYCVVSFLRFLDCQNGFFKDFSKECSKKIMIKMIKQCKREQNTIKKKRDQTNTLKIKEQTSKQHK